METEKESCSKSNLSFFSPEIELIGIRFLDWAYHEVVLRNEPRFKERWDREIQKCESFDKKILNSVLESFNSLNYPNTARFCLDELVVRMNLGEEGIWMCYRSFEQAVILGYLDKHDAFYSFTESGKKAYEAKYCKR